MDTKQTFTLFLASWQTRMLWDFLKIKADRVRCKPGVIRCPASYKIPDIGLSKRDWVLYLTDEQMKIVKEKFSLRTAISGINITDELIKQKSVVFM